MLLGKEKLVYVALFILQMIRNLMKIEILLKEYEMLLSDQG